MGCPTKQRSRKPRVEQTRRRWPTRGSAAGQGARPTKSSQAATKWAGCNTFWSSFSLAFSSQLVDVCQNLRNRAIEVSRYLLSHFNRSVQSLSQWGIFHDRDQVLDGLLTNPQRQIILALRYYDR